MIEKAKSNPEIAELLNMISPKILDFISSSKEGNTHDAEERRENTLPGSVEVRNKQSDSIYNVPLPFYINIPSFGSTGGNDGFYSQNWGAEN